MDKGTITQRISHGLKWENKLLKLERNVETLNVAFCEDMVEKTFRKQHMIWHGLSVNLILKDI